MTRHPHRRAFTLIELLVVISIIAILMALLLPTLRQARRQARLTQCLAHLRGYSIGLLSYTVDDRDGRYPLTYDPWGGSPWAIWNNRFSNAGITADKYDYMKMLLSYLGDDAESLWCPLDNVWRPAMERNRDPNFSAQLYNHTSSGWDQYITGYTKYAGMVDPNGAMDFTHSGNSNADEVGPGATTYGPRRPEDGPNDVILTDILFSEVGPAWYDVHASDDALWGTPQSYRDNNVAYSDGHVETHKHTLDVTTPQAYWGDHYVLRGIDYWLY